MKRTRTIVVSTPSVRTATVFAVICVGALATAAAGAKPQQGKVGKPVCTSAIRDAASANPNACLNASSTPTTGMLYPLGAEFDLDPAGNVVAAGSIRSNAGGFVFPDGSVQVTAATLASTDARTPISSLPFTIDSCGSYFLTDCLTGTSGSNGITIEVDDVTLDLNGFSLIGVAGSGDGIAIQTGVERVSVFDGNIHDWGGSGIDASDTGNHAFRDLRLDDNGDWGMDVFLASIVDSCMASGNGASGIRVQGGGVIINCVTNNNGGNAIAVSLVNDGAAVISHCVARDNSGDGATAGNHGLFTACVTTDNGDDGLEVFDGLISLSSSRANAASNYDAAGGSSSVHNH